MLSHSVSLTYIYAFISPPSSTQGDLALLRRTAATLCPRPAVSPRERVESLALITQVDIQPESLPWLGWAGPGWAGLPPAGEPLAGCLGSAAPCRLARRVGGGWCSLTGVVPLPSGGRGGNKKSSVTSRLMGRGITARSCN